MGARLYGSHVNQFTSVRILGLDYHHLSLPDGEDLYLTEYGLPFLENLLPNNFWTDKEWFENHSKKLRGTSILYKVTTKEFEGSRALRGEYEKYTDDLRESLLKPAWDKFEKGAPL